MRLESIIVVWLAFISYSLEGQIDILNKKALHKLIIQNEKEINTANMESSPSFFGNKLVFVSSLPKEGNYDKQIDATYFDLSISDIAMDNHLLNRVLVSNKINSIYHEGPSAYHLQTNTLFLTRNVKERITTSEEENDVYFLRIYSADLNKSTPKAEPLSFAIQGYNVCHPSLSNDGKTMIFASDRPGSIGKMDLYATYFDGKEWTSIQNLGTGINSQFNEVFPFLYKDSVLIFSSDKPGGNGQLDLYVSVLSNGSWQSAQILPKPFNSAFDDLGLIVRDNGRSGYFASDRLGGSGGDDIYSFASDEPIFKLDRDKESLLSMNILDKLTLQPIKGASAIVSALNIDINDFTLSSYNVDMLSGTKPGEVVLQLTPKKGSPKQTAFSDENGKIECTINQNQKYLIQVTSNDHAPLSMIYDYYLYGQEVNLVVEPTESDGLAEENDSIYYDEADTLLLNLEVEQGRMDQLNEVISGLELGNSVIFDQIYYDYNSAKLRIGATQELDVLANSMIANGQLMVRLESHTDTRGPSDYNMILSIARANEARNYLIDKGISEDRIEIKGFGESKPRNHCYNNVKCKEIDHQFNRRTEVVIIQN